MVVVPKSLFSNWEVKSIHRSSRAPKAAGVGKIKRLGASPLRRGSMLASRNESCPTEEDWAMSGPSRGEVPYGPKLQSS